MKITAVLALFISTIASAASGSDLVGRWIHVKYPSLRVQIAENNSSYVVTEFKESSAKKYVGKIKDGVLIISVGALESKADVETTSGELVLGGQRYRRLKPNESFEYTPKGQPKGW